jgi:hypothetical protein
VRGNVCAREAGRGHPDIWRHGQVDAANDQIRALREACGQGAGDARLSRLWELRRAGWTLRDALEAVEASSQHGS